MEVMVQVTNNIIQNICQCRTRPPNRAGGQATCAEPTPTQGMGGWEAVLRRCLPELVQKWAKTLGIRTACSNTDAGPAVAFVSLLVRYIPTEIPSAHVRAIVMGHLVDSLAQTNQSERPGRIEPLRPAYQIDRHSYRYGAYTAYEAYRPRPLPRTLRIRVRHHV